MRSATDSIVWDGKVTFMCLRIFTESVTYNHYRYFCASERKNNFLYLLRIY